MKSVLISIRPKWCGLIASGKKTVEVRKTAPKLPPPFRCYIYCTSVKSMNLQDYVAVHQATGGAVDDWSGKVIGEFVCYHVTNLFLENHLWLSEEDVLHTCLTADELREYGCGAHGLYGWHISDLKIYDQPRELSKFRVEDKPAIKACKHRFRAGQPEYVARHGGWLQGGWSCMKTGEPEWCENCLTKPLTRPPQSWCYVEEMP